MSVYALLLKHVAARRARIALGLWYALLIVLILLYGGTPETTIRYMEL